MDDALINFTRDLVRIPSVLGDEHRVAERVLAEMRFLSFDEADLDEAGNAVGVRIGAGDGPKADYSGGNSRYMST